MIVDVDVVGQITESVNESLLLWTSIYCIFWARVRESCVFCFLITPYALSDFVRVLFSFGFQRCLSWWFFVVLTKSAAFYRAV